MKTSTALALIAYLAAPAALSATSAPARQAAQTTTAAAPAADVLGTWNGTVNGQQGPIPVQITLKKEGAKIVGTIGSAMGEAPLEAEVKGKALTIWFTFQTQNGPMAIQMDAAVEGDTAKGTMSFGGQPGGDWSATRAKGATANAPAPEPANNQAPVARTDVSGTWTLTVELPNMTANPAVTLKQDAEKLTGEYVSAQYGKFPITGTVKGADVNFWFGMNVEGNALNVTYTGTLDKDGTLKGSVNYGDMMSGTFVAKRK